MSKCEDMEVRRDACFILLIFSCFQPPPPRTLPHTVSALLLPHSLLLSSHITHSLASITTSLGVGGLKKRKRQIFPQIISCCCRLSCLTCSPCKRYQVLVFLKITCVFLQKNLSSQRSQSDDVRDSLVKMLLFFLLTSCLSRICRWPISHFFPQDSSMWLQVLPLKLLRQWTSFSGLHIPHLWNVNLKSFYHIHLLKWKYVTIYKYK